MPSTAGKPFAAFGTAAEMEAFMRLSFGSARLRQGEKVPILDSDGARPLKVSFVPVRYRELQEELVPEQTRKLPHFTGYGLHLKTAKTIVDFNKENKQTYFTGAFRVLEKTPAA